MGRQTRSHGYRPPFGLDIRIRPDGGDKAVHRAARRCAVRGCEAPGEHPAPLSPLRMQERQYMCLDHVREFNRNWNFFAGMNDAEIAAWIDSNLTGHRPTWAMGANAWAENRTPRERRSGLNGFHPGRSRPRGPQAHEEARRDDIFGLFGEDRPRQPAAAETAPRWTRLQRAALEKLQLEETATLNEIRQRYKELVKRFHPDLNGGDRSAEDRLAQVIKAYQILRPVGRR